MTITGSPAFKTTIDTPILHEAMMGGYGYKKMNLAGGETLYSDIPEKNNYSHLGDACQYMVLMAGVGYHSEEYLDDEPTRVRAR